MRTRSSFLSVAVMKHPDQINLGREAIIWLILPKSITEGSLGRKLEQKSWRNSACWLALWLTPRLMLGSFLYSSPRDGAIHSELGPPASINYQTTPHKNVKDQSDLGNSSMFSSQIILVCISLTVSANENNKTVWQKYILRNNSCLWNAKTIAYNVITFSLCFFSVQFSCTECKWLLSFSISRFCSS